MPPLFRDFLTSPESLQPVDSSEKNSDSESSNKIWFSGVWVRQCLGCARLALVGAGVFANGQPGSSAPNPTSAVNPFFGSVTAHQPATKTLKLSLDEAVSLGLKNNLGLKEAEAGGKDAARRKNEALQNFCHHHPHRRHRRYQHNLAALGFGPGAIKQLQSSSPWPDPRQDFRQSPATT